MLGKSKDEDIDDTRDLLPFDGTKDSFFFSLMSKAEAAEVDIESAQFKNVNFTYEDTNINALQNVSFSINKGETLAILGKTGSGKSTILSLLTRMYDCKRGEILIDGQAISKVNLFDLRNSIGIVPQDAFLFSDSIKNNIKFGKESATDDEVMEAAKNAVVHDNIVQFKNQYETILGERGITISGGQKQRVSIARAIIKNPEILLFDDCLSAVDTETEEQILNNLLESEYVFWVLLLFELVFVCCVKISPKSLKKFPLL